MIHLTDDELEYLDGLMQGIETSIMEDVCILSTYALCELVDYDGDCIYLDLEFDDNGKRYYENFLIDRSNMELL